MVIVHGRAGLLGRDSMKHGMRDSRMQSAPRGTSRRRGRRRLVALTVSCAVMVGAVVGPHAVSVTGRMLVPLKSSSSSQQWHIGLEMKQL